MMTVDTDAAAPAGAAQKGAVLSMLTWLVSSDHKKIGRLLVGEAMVASVGAGVIGALLGLERMSEGYAIFAGNAAVQLVAVFHYLLVFGVLGPVLLGIAVSVVPLQVGSRAISFPRLAVFGRSLWAFGTIMVIVSVAGNGGPGGGNTDLVDMYLLAVIASSVGLLALSVSVATTVLTSRAPGMTTDLLPAFSWGGLVGSVAAALSLPVLVGTSIYLYLDHTYTKAVFGGNKGVTEWLHFAFTQPATFLWAAIAIGILAEIAPVTARSRQKLRGPVLTGIGLVSTGAVGAVTQSQHVLVLDGSLVDKIKSALPFLIFNGLPALGLVIVLVATLSVLSDGSPKPGNAFAFAFLGNGMVLLGMLGGIVQNISDAGLAGTSFEEGATTFVAYGALMAAIGGVIYWAPKLWGVMVDDFIAMPVVGLALLGTVLASMGNYIAGFANQPVDLTDGFSYEGPRTLWNALVASGHVLVAISIIAVALAVFIATRSGEKAPDDPWNGHTLEWSVPSPAPRNNFASIATVGSAEPVLDAKPNTEVSA